MLWFMPYKLTGRNVAKNAMIMLIKPLMYFKYDKK